MKVYIYDSLWQIKRKLYGIEGLKFPVPVPYPVLFFFCAGLIIMFVVTGMFGALNWNQFAVKYIFFPGLFAWFCTKIKLDGKAPHRFFLGLLRYVWMPKQLTRYKPVKVCGICKYEMEVFRL